MKSKNVSKGLSLLLALGMFSTLPACYGLNKKVNKESVENSKKQKNFNIPYEKITLENGLQVIFHIDKSDPIISTSILYHVGSSREEVGRTGFAHLFEHMLFQRSENVEEDQFFKKIQDAGGTLNGFTFNDGTMYYEVVPKDALEMVLWMEADRMGYFINSVTPESFAIQQNVVQNEKRQRYDNRPYGYTNYIIDKNMFPKSHPYNWQVIGSMKDLTNASLDDVKKFYSNYYGPNNATLVLSGDFEINNAKKLIKKYFGEIKKGKTVKDLPKMNITLNKTKKVFYQDKAAPAAELNMVWPVPEEYSKDSYALSFLAKLLSYGKDSPLYKVLVEEKNLTAKVNARNDSMELAGKFWIRIKAFPNGNLNNIEKSIFKALEKFEAEGINESTIEGIKARLETETFSNYSNLIGKSFDLAFFNTFTKDAGFASEYIKNIQSVTKEDIIRVYNKYIKNKPFISTSFVPKDKTELAIKGSTEFFVPEEKLSSKNVIAKNNPKNIIKKTPSKFDRSIEPKKGKAPLLNLPKINYEKISNGLKIYSIKNNEVPLVEFNLDIKGGLLFEQKEKAGVSNLLAQLLMEGTENRTSIQLQKDIDLLGSRISISAGRENFKIKGSSLSRNYDKTMEIFTDILLNPRWDEKEFSRIKRKTIDSLKQRIANPDNLASDVFRKFTYGKNSILSLTNLGTIESINKITIDDLKEYYNNYLSPSLGAFLVVGDIKNSQIKESLKPIVNNWKNKSVELPKIELPELPKESKIYFIDVPGAKQSVIRVGHLSLGYNHPDFYSATIMNHKLGGNFNSNLNMILREEKGYTYGARSYFYGSMIPGPFLAAAKVKSNTTEDSLRIFKTEIENHKLGINNEDLKYTKNALIKANARKFEENSKLISILSNINKYNLPFDYIKNQEKIVGNVSKEEIKELANKYLKTDNMVYLVVGDAKTQFDKLKNIGLGKPILIDKDLNIVNKK